MLTLDISSGFDERASGSFGATGASGSVGLGACAANSSQCLCGDVVDCAGSALHLIAATLGSSISSLFSIPRSLESWCMRTLIDEIFWSLLVKKGMAASSLGLVAGKMRRPWKYIRGLFRSETSINWVIGFDAFKYFGAGKPIATNQRGHFRI